MKPVEVVVTWVCNWYCEYCCVDTHKRPRLDWKDTIAKLDQIEAGSLVTISGGEPGTLKRHQIESMINKLQAKGCQLQLNTNGLFLKKYRDLTGNFTRINYHCSENLDETDDIIEDPELPLEYLLIVTDNNYSKLESFLNRYKHISFYLVPASNPKDIHNVELSPRLRHKMLVNYHSRMTKQSKSRTIKEIDFDSIIYL